MKKKTKKSKSTFNENTDWIQLIKLWATESLKKIVADTFMEMRKKTGDFLRKIIENVSRLVVSSLIILIGLIFVMIGLAILINEFVAISGSVGYIVVGILVVLIGLVINSSRRN
ncbi:MAG: hypothetical protein U9Q72_00230 [Patescibacteria group bacterium]|nr:hypothetical protein [Patescibacteria group bacterium]